MLDLMGYRTLIAFRIDTLKMRWLYDNNGKRGMTSSTALRLEKALGVSADFWMNLQLRWDLYFAKQSESEILKAIKPIVHLQSDASPC